jgi:hypothetical protein
MTFVGKGCTEQGATYVVLAHDLALLPNEVDGIMIDHLL